MPTNKEMWDLLDSNGRPTGNTVCRHLKGSFPKGRFHLVVHIWVKNSQGNFLIQKRSPFKQPMAGEWAATGGAVVSGENSQNGARRELSEELGIKAGERELEFVGRLKRKISIVDIWKLEKDIEADSLVLQSDEVERVKWVSPDELRQMIKKGDFHNYGKEYFDIIFSA